MRCGREPREQVLVADAVDVLDGDVDQAQPRPVEPLAGGETDEHLAVGSEHVGTLGPCDGERLAERAHDGDLVRQVARGLRMRVADGDALVVGEPADAALVVVEPADLEVAHDPHRMQPAFGVAGGRERLPDDRLELGASERDGGAGGVARGDPSGDEHAATVQRDLDADERLGVAAQRIGHDPFGDRVAHAVGVAGEHVLGGDHRSTTPGSSTTCDQLSTSLRQPPSGSTQVTSTPRARRPASRCGAGVPT
jgi:hypothetical protein